MLRVAFARVFARQAVAPWGVAHRRFAASFSSEQEAAPPLEKDERLPAAPLVYISGEEMSHYMMNLIRKEWIDPHLDTSRWEFYDLSCKSRDDTEDQVLTDCIEAGKRICCIFKEPTITPTMAQKEKFGLKKTWGSPNGTMRREWNGFTISRDTIHIEGVDLGFKKPVFFDRHAVGGEYGAAWKPVGSGLLRTTFEPDNRDHPTVEVCSRRLDDELNAVVTYHNPMDNVVDLAHHFFSRCLKGGITPYVTSKKTVFKWQELFWDRMKGTFDAHYKWHFQQAGLLDQTGGELRHILSDAATMVLMRWTDGGFGLASHNYDGDMLTDEIAQVHRSPGFITSNLIGRREDGVKIMEFESSHGTVPDMWEMHLRGEETSMNPISMVEALIESIIYSAELHSSAKDRSRLHAFAHRLRAAVHSAYANGYGTRDMVGKMGLTSEAFVDIVARDLKGLPLPPPPATPELTLESKKPNVEAMRDLFTKLDKNGDGAIDFDEFTKGLNKLGVLPKQKEQYTD